MAFHICGRSSKRGPPATNGSAPITFHDLRHDWAHRARAAGWSLEEIAVYAGHQTKDGAPAIATTVRYTLPSRQQLKEQLQRLQG